MVATNFHGGKNQIFVENTDQISRELDLRPKHIVFKASQMKSKGFSGPPMQFKAFLRQPKKFKAFSRLYEPCDWYVHVFAQHFCDSVCNCTCYEQ